MACRARRCNRRLAQNPPAPRLRRQGLSLCLTLPRGALTMGAMALADRIRQWTRQLTGPGRRTASDVRIDKALVEAAITFSEARRSVSTVMGPDWYAASAYQRANTGPGGAPHLAWQRIAPIYAEIRPRWKTSPDMLAYVLAYAVGRADAGALTPEDLESLLGRVARRGAVVVNESLVAEGMQPIEN